MSTVPAPANAAELLGSLDELGRPTGAPLARLVAAVEWLAVPAGKRLFTEGDPADGMYVLFEGRMRFVVESAPTPLAAWELDAVGVFGEGALLTGGGRSRTAVVLRDALLARVPAALFDEVLASSPSVAAQMARRVARRTVFPAADERRAERTPATVALVSRTVSTARVEALASDLGTSAPPVALGIERRGEIFDAARHSDRVLVVVDRIDARDVAPILDMIGGGIDPLAMPALELVLLHRDRGPLERDPSRFPYDDFAHVIHVREHDPADLRRLSRHVCGTAVALVLGGGGAKGLAHIGVLRALDELGIPVDTVGGSSMGAIIGALHAMGWSWEKIYRFSSEWNDRRLRWDVTLPTVSVYSGRRAKRIFDETFGDLGIEDLWLPFFCTSVDLSTFRLVLHRHGPAATWVRASSSAPGLWPPVVDDAGHLHIDGGQLNNVPTDLMSARHSGPIVAVDVFAEHREMTLGPDADPPIGLFHLIGRQARGRYPSIADTFTRCSLLGSLQHQEGARQYADFYITPDVNAVSFRGFDRIELAAEIGYRAALEALSGWPFAMDRAPVRPSVPDAHQGE